MKITIVIVLYKQIVEKSKTFKTLNKALLTQKIRANELEVVVYDNSPDKQEFDAGIVSNYKISYVHDPRNLGIATAYNYAFNVAQKNESDWLLLLDQDTELTVAYAEEFRRLDKFESNIVAVVPKINSERTMISPVFSELLRPLQGQMPSAGLQGKPVMAINSGTIVRVSFLEEINGFSNDFPLDYLDHWLFHEINRSGKKVWLLDTTLAHELSVMDYDRVSLERYQSILDSEIRFYKEYKKDLLPAYKRQLIKRLFKQFLLVKNKKIAAYTLRRLVSI